MKTVLKKLIQIAGYFFWAIPAISFAALPDEIQVYDGEILEPQELSLDLHSNYSIKGISTPAFQDERVTNHATRITPEFNYGLTKTIELGFYLPLINTPTYGSELAGYKFRVKWLPFQQNKNSDISMGFNIEYAHLSRGMEASAEHIEYRFIFAKELDSWKWAVNPVFGSDISSGYSKTPSFSYYLQALKKSDGLLKDFGLEYYQNMGSTNDFSLPSQQSKSLFGVIDFELGKGLFKEWNFHFGIGRGWSTADPWMVKLIISPKL